MKKKSLMLLAALMTLGTACTNNDDTGESPATGLISEIQIELAGKGEGVEYSKAIASDSENKIDNLSIYVFASDKADGTYYYRETWTSAAADDKDAKTFSLQDAGTKKKASIFPTDALNLSYLKLFLIANPADALYGEDGTTGLTLNAATAFDGTNPTPTDATTETAFLATYSKVLAGDANITPSLTMTGQGKTKIVGSVSKLNIDLLRTVARFDIDNTTITSNLTIKSIAIVQGRKTAPLWNTAPTVVAEGELATSPLLMTYHEVDYTALPNANRGLTESAIYTNPSLATDKCVLQVKGTYKVGSTGEERPAEYTVPFQKTDDGGVVTPLAIERNNRYTLRILDVTSTTIKATFDIEDWISDGGINVKPGNDAPSYTAATLFGDTPDDNKPAALTAGDTTQYRVEANKTFKIVMAASGPTSVEKAVATAPATKVVSPGDGWLTVEDLTDASYEVKDGITYTTFIIKTFSGEISGAEPVSLRFINETASLDPDLQPVLTFFATPGKPAMTDAGGHNMENTVNATNPVAVTAAMKKANGSMIRVKANNFEGLIVDAPAGMTAKEVAREGLTSTYELTINDVTTIGDGPVTVTLKNAADDNQTSTVVITLEKAPVNLVTASVLPSFDQGINPAPVVQPDGSVNANMYVGTQGKRQIQVRMTSPNGVAGEFVNENPTKVTVTKGNNNIYTIETTDQAAAGDTYTIGFKSAADPNSVTNVNITMIEATISVEVSEGLNVTNKKIQLSVNTIGSKGSAKIKAPVGSTITVSGHSWLKVDCPLATTRNDDGDYAVLKAEVMTNDDPRPDVTITIVNAATGASEEYTLGI